MQLRGIVVAFATGFVVSLAAACAPYTCDQTTCIGCCIGNTCHAGTTNAICGKLGEVCKVCTGCSFEGTCTNPVAVSDGGVP